MVVGRAGRPQGRRRLRAARPGLPGRAPRAACWRTAAALVVAHARRRPLAAGPAGAAAPPAARWLPATPPIAGTDVEPADPPGLAARPPGRPADDLAYVIYTSGAPQGATAGWQVTHAQRHSGSFDRHLGRPGSASALSKRLDRCSTRYAFDFSVWELWGALLARRPAWSWCPPRLRRLACGLHDAAERATRRDGYEPDAVRLPSCRGGACSAQQTGALAAPVVFGGEALGWALRPGSRGAAREGRGW